ncbi:MAG TPA: cytidylate kinase-like family protein [Acidobacteriota bacterium]|nr:cytidylate kinase-like family protein [Acidobacteriota bacterium]
MLPTKSGDDYGTALLAERQMLLRTVRDRALHEISAARATNPGYRFITISRRRGSLGDAIAHDLARRLGWQVFDREIVDHIALHSNVRQTLVEQLDERAQNLIHESVQRLLNMAAGASFGAEEYRDALLKALAFVAGRGDAILVGRGANFALRSESGGFHIRIVASPEVRIRRLMQRWQISLADARQRIDQMDSERRNFVRHHFKQDIDDFRHYDAVFNTDNLTARQVADSIMAMLSGTVPEIESSSDATDTKEPKAIQEPLLETP